MADDKKILDDAKEAFKVAAEAEDENRKAFIDDLRFARLGEQWPDAIRKNRERSNRPCLTINRLPSFIRQVVNDARQNKPSIKVHPADGDADPPTAEVINGLIRNIEYTSNADVAYDTACEFSVSAGFGYWRVDLQHAEEDTFDLDIAINRIANPLMVYGDPNDTGADSAEWNSAFVTDLLTRDAFERKYKGAEEVDWDGGEYANLQAPWAEEKKILIAEWWRREEEDAKLLLLSNGQPVLESVYQAQKDVFDAQGFTVTKERPTKTHKVMQYLLSGAEVLKTTEWAGKYIPIIPVYGEEVNVEGKRYFRSLIRDAKDPQQMLNFWRTASTELVALAPKAPFIGPKGAFKTDIDKWNTANTDSHAFIQYDGQGMPQRQPFAGTPAGVINEALMAQDDMKSIMGIYDASLGAKSNETSGRAILARQREGDVGTFHFIDNVRRAIRHTGRILIDLIPHVYTQDRVIRVLGQDGKDPRTVPLGAATPVLGPDGNPSLDQQGQPIQKIYDLSVGKYDLTVETGPSYTTRREEAAAEMTELIRAYPPAAPLIGDILARNLDWPGADEIAQRLKAMLPPQIRGQDPQVQQLMQQMQAMHAELVSLKQDKSAEQQKIDIDRYKAESDRIKALGTSITPDSLVPLVHQIVSEALGTPIAPQTMNAP